VFETDVDGIPYQVVVSFQYDTRSPTRLAGVAGFTVNLAWVRDRYFAELTGQIARIGGLSGDVSLGIFDESDRTVTMTRPNTGGLHAVERSFGLLFADPTLLDSPRRMMTRTWTARAAAASDSPLAAAVAGTNDGFFVMSGAAAAVLAGLLLTWRGVRVAADAARMKSEFVSTLTHELKTPLTVVRLLADTLARGRYDSQEAARGYAAQLSRESQNLSSLIDHLLAYARLTYGHHAYTFEAVDVGELVDGVIDHFHALLNERGFSVSVDVAPELPPVRGDRAALLQMLDNLVDNAIKYSERDRVLGIDAVSRDRDVTIGVTDKGAGIDRDEIDRVCDRFFRGRHVTARGSGLGLAIARQIAEDHKGRLRIESVRGEGTRVEVTLPSAA
jgi:signal transduction histidine kinase